MFSVTGKSPHTAVTGFTLIELLIVFSLLITLTAILAPLLLPSPTRTLHAAASDVATTLRETRRHAQADQERRRFLIDTETRQYVIQGQDSPRTLPDDVNVELTTGKSLIVDESRGGIDFFPDGSSTGGRVTLRIAERSLKVDIEWLTGRIRVQENEP